MKTMVSIGSVLLAVILAYSARPPLPQAGGQRASGQTSFRIIFGERQDATRDYSGSLVLTKGKVVRLAPWRFFRDDAVQGITGWKLQIKRGIFESQPDKPRSLAGGGPPQNVIPAGVVATVEAPATARAEIRTAAGNFAFPLEDLHKGNRLTFAAGDVIVEPAATVERVSPPDSADQQDYPSMAVTRSGVVWVAWQGYQDLGDHIYTRHSTPTGWSEIFRLTDSRADVYRTAVAEDAKGRIWVVWSQRGEMRWNLYARRYDGREWSPRSALDSGASPNMSHRLVAARNGKLHLVWIGHQNGASHVYHRVLDGDTWSPPAEVSGPSAWAPDASADSQGNLYIAWDSYRTGNYDIFLRRITAAGQMDPVQQVTRSSAFQAHASVAVDAQDRVWVAWDESGANWGKDWTHEDMWRATTLYTDRSIRVAVLDQGRWKQPADLEAAVPARYRRYWQLPRLASGADGRLWMLLQCRTSSANNRADFWANNGRWEHFLTSYDGERWSPLLPVPESSSRPEGATAIAAGTDSVWLAWTNDNRSFGPGGGFAQPTPMRYEIWGAAVAHGSSLVRKVASLDDFTEPTLPAAPIHPNEPADVARIRSYRSGDLRILRGDFHRHTEISTDGSGDGSVEDYFRYMIDVADMDTGIIGDHNAGNDVEYTWWRTEKAIDLFLIPGRFTPLFGYERSVAYPNGHRNVVFAQRGVRTLPITPAEQKGAINTGQVLYPYLKQHRGIAMEHSLATGQGTDWRDNDPELEPLVELYQGYHAAYEYEGGPRAETDNFLVRIHGAYQPSGFYWNALKKGYKLGVQASSDHISTHTSYAMIYTPTTSRRDIVESMRRRHAYAATDNIILDFHTEDGHRMGDAFEARTPPRFQVKVHGTDRIQQIEIIRNGEFVYTIRPDSPTAEFTYVDNNPPSGERWYYVRVTQIDRNLAWSSPMWVK